jgi:hypothetical protein
MKTSLKISLLANILLAAMAGWLATRQRAGENSSPSPAAVAAAPAVEVAPVVSAPANQARSEPFRWSQLAAADYRVFIKNLRGIGCPEATVRAIVSADVHAAYHQRIQVLGQKLSDLASSPWSTQLAAQSSGQALKNELQKLPGEETAEIAGLLGTKPATVAADPEPVPVRKLLSIGEQRDLERPVSMPLAFQPVDLKALNVNSNQLQVINDLRQKFQQQIGGPNQDPNDPAYLKRWQAAQRNADEWMGLLLGRDFRLKYQLQVQNQQAQSAQ